MSNLSQQTRVNHEMNGNTTFIRATTGQRSKDLTLIWDFDNRMTMATEMATRQFDVRVLTGDPQSDLHNQCDRVDQQPDSQAHTQSQIVPELRLSNEVALDGGPRGVEEMDHTKPSLESRLEPLCDHVKSVNLVIIQIESKND